MSADRPRRALVTGASNGIGLAVATVLAAEGAMVTGLDVEPGAGEWESVELDLSDLRAVEAAASRLGARGFDVLVNCAGTFAATPLRDLDSAAYHRLLAVDLHAPVLFMQHLGRGMADRGWGRIVNVSSVHAAVGEPGALAYDIAKAGIEAATRVAAIELAPHGVLANAVAPGFVSTRMSVVDGVDELTTPEFQEFYVRRGRLPLGRAASPTEVAELVAWLAGERNTYVTGQSVRVDGGLTARF
ncbi:MAG: SDR family NAD(P)-dependent oxidoreductase [Propionicimonas sp.]|uniref:SDR family NAD(P)-dependent oxidoreductase n=1 Tax=Propionicimonas sp. TaxID=1955623 RepID=UPI003D135AC9